MGFGPAIVLQLAVLGGIWLLAGRGGTRPVPRLLIVGGLALAALNAATLLLAGKPWGETSAFALWGSKMVTSAGVGCAWLGRIGSGPASTRNSIAPCRWT